MPPTLRSSPAATRTTRNSTKSPVPTPERSSTPGKPRYCTSCKRPRKGHPREGCPYTDSENATQNDTVSDSPTRSVAAALDALNLAVADADTDVEDEPEMKPRRIFTRMPGTLLTPTSSFMYSQSSQLSSCKDETPPAAFDASFSSSAPYLGLSQLSDIDLPPTPHAHTPRPATPPRATAARPLARTLTSDERAAFTASLTHLAKATVYVLPTSDVPAICTAAANRGLSTRALALDHADTLVVVGRTAAAVEVLFYQIEAKMHALVPRPTGGILTAAGKALAVTAVGAAATWGALAFS
ncbi:hypothetical protein B0H17DRAFT_1053190 [Mycena rosella]|uniref:Uncharacterized protein n=1 Tax=Mycena rosella TaxID=1033263 RepID=A0AAD7DQP2_MYCRO|nr:hypothetical protein B0H17DRAFT_1053190 [Mycena rosella]